MTLLPTSFTYYDPVPPLDTAGTLCIPRLHLQIPFPHLWRHNRGFLGLGCRFLYGTTIVPTTFDWAESRRAVFQTEEENHTICFPLLRDLNTTGNAMISHGPNRLNKSGHWNDPRKLYIPELESDNAFQVYYWYWTTRNTCTCIHTCGGERETDRQRILQISSPWVVLFVRISTFKSSKTEAVDDRYHG